MSTNCFVRRSAIRNLRASEAAGFSGLTAVFLGSACIPVAEARRRRPQTRRCPQVQGSCEQCEVMRSIVLRNIRRRTQWSLTCEH
jgi:hypothetical protein